MASHTSKLVHVQVLSKKTNCSRDCDVLSVGLLLKVLAIWLLPSHLDHRPVLVFF